MASCPAKNHPKKPSCHVGTGCARASKDRERQADCKTLSLSALSLSCHLEKACPRQTDLGELVLWSLVCSFFACGFLSFVSSLPHSAGTQKLQARRVAALRAPVGAAGGEVYAVTYWRMTSVHTPADSYLAGSLTPLAPAFALAELDSVVRHSSSFFSLSLFFFLFGCRKEIKNREPWDKSKHKEPLSLSLCLCLLPSRSRSLALSFVSERVRGPGKRR